VKRRALVAFGVWLALWLGRVLLERDMTMHMIVQLPMLAGIGLAFAAILRPHEPRWLIGADWLGIPGLVLAVFASSFWMLPIMLDDALANPAIDLMKFLSLPLLVGAPLGLSWRRMPPLGRAFVWANFIPKIGAIGGRYLAAPERLCAYYRLDQQAIAGWTLIIVAIVLGLLWFIAAFIGWPDQSREELAGFERQNEPGRAPYCAAALRR
jgi:hypothetical protein